MSTDAARRLSLLYQLYLTGQASREFMREAMAGTGMTGEEYAIFSYLFANGARPLSRAARDLHLPITTLAGLIAPLVEAGDVERLPDPGDRRARLVALTEAGYQRLGRTIPIFSRAYRELLVELDANQVDPETVYAALADLREGIVTTTARLRAEGRQARVVGH